MTPPPSFDAPFLLTAALLAGCLLLLPSAPAHAQRAPGDSAGTAQKTPDSQDDTDGRSESFSAKAVDQMTKPSVPETTNVLQRPPNIDSLARQTSFAIAAENYDVVARNLEIITEYREDDGRLFLLLSRAYSQLNQYDKAIEAQKEAIRLGSKTVDTRFRLAILLSQDGREEESLSVLRSLLQTHADRQIIRMRYAETLIAVGRMDEGSNEVDRLLQMYPDDVSVRMSAVEAMWKAGRGDRAFEIARLNIETFPDTALLHGQLADLYLRTEQWDAATTALEKMESRIQRQKGWANAIYNANLGYLYARNGRAQEGLDMIQESLDIDENNPYALRNLGVAYLNLGQTDRACNAFETSIDRNYSGAYHPTMQFGRHPQALLDAYCSASN